MARSYLYSALSVIILAVGGIVYTFAEGNEPLLGLDLQGGVSVVLEPKAEEGVEITGEGLDDTLEIIRNRVDGLGVAEPEISRQGDTIVVELPGVDEQQRALELVGRTAKLVFRPVIFDPETMLTLGFELEGLDTGISVDGETPGTDDGAGTGDGDDTGTGDGTTTDGADTGATDGGDDEESLGVFRRRQATDDDTVPEETVPDDTVLDETTPDETAPDDGAAPLDSSGSPVFDAALDACVGPVTPPEEDDHDAYVLLVDDTGLPYCLGPVFEYQGQELTGAALEGAGVGLGVAQGWTVNLVFREDTIDDNGNPVLGINGFNAASAACFGTAVFADGEENPCPSGLLAIVLDHEVISAPTIRTDNFERDRVQISGNFDEASANDLALSLRYGSLPFELEAQDVRTVSATVGDDVLRSGIIAGLVGLAFVAIYLLAYYRLAGLVAIGGLVLSFLMLWTIIGYLGSNYGLAISLSGLVGLIVSIGVSADSNIVYFENVKDIASSGRRVTTSVERAYRTAISTILKADVVSLIAAGLLYYLTVGAVKGFALYLGIATILDLVVSYLFMRPALVWLANRKAVRENPRLLGMPGGSK